MNIKGHELEFLEENHIYLVDGVILPSITQIIKIKFGSKYANVPQDVLNNASLKGTEVHRAIELFDKEGKPSSLPEVRNYKFLKKAYEFETIGNEIPVILFENEEPIACGTLDLLITERNILGIGDIKRTSVLDKEYLFYQLNLYRIAYQQCYGTKIEFLRALHLRKDVRRYIEIPINEELAWELVHEYQKENEHE